MCSTKRSRRLHLAFALILCSGFGAVALSQAGPAPAKEVEALLKLSSDKRNRKQARQYEDKFLKAIDFTLLAAMKICTSQTPDTVEPGAIAFIIGADGRVKRLIWSADIPMAECVGKKLRSIITLPRPPEDNWVDGIGVANHSQAEKNAAVAKGPPDTPLKLTKETLAAYDRAIAPYIAKARATYPDAKRRFLVSLPPGYRFSVRVRSLTLMANARIHLLPSRRFQTARSPELSRLSSEWSPVTKPVSGSPFRRRRLMTG